MYVANPRTTIVPKEIEAGGTATVTMDFQAASALYVTPVEIILIFDQSDNVTQEVLNRMKAAAKEFINHISVASTGAPSGTITNGSRVGLVGLSGVSDRALGLTHDVSRLNAGIDALQLQSGVPDYKQAFLEADQMMLTDDTVRHAVVLLTHSADGAAADADAMAEKIKTRGREFYCMGLLPDPSRLNIWASTPAKDHVAYTDDPAKLSEIIYAIAAEAVLAGVLDGKLRQVLTQDFRLKNVVSVTDGQEEAPGDQELIWTIPHAAIPQQPSRVSIIFEVQHIGTKGGTLAVQQSIAYEDRAKNTLDFPAAKLEVKASGGGREIYPEPCPEPTEIQIPGCRDAVRAELNPAHLLSLGRIVQMDVRLKAVCPGKRVAASIILMERAPDGTELPIGVKHILVPAQEGETCQDLTLHCVQFSLPEGLDVTGGTDSICNSRNFSARVIANYVDTDFTCCDTKAEIL